MRRASRYHGTGIGANVFTPTAPAVVTSCPAGTHYVADSPSLRGLSPIGACVPNAVSIRPLTLRPAQPAAPPLSPAYMAPAPTTVAVQPLTLPFPSPTSGGDAAAAPAPAASAACPALWPWWWLLVAGGLGAGLGYYMQQNQKAVRKNAGRVAGRIVNRASDVAIARLIG